MCTTSLRLGLLHQAQLAFKIKEPSRLRQTSIFFIKFTVCWKVQHLREPGLLSEQRTVCYRCGPLNSSCFMEGQVHCRWLLSIKMASRCSSRVSLITTLPLVISIRIPDQWIGQFAQNPSWLRQTVRHSILPSLVGHRVERIDSH